MKNFCIKTLFIFFCSLASFTISSAQTKPLEEMSVEELRTRVMELEKQSVKIKLLKEENRRLRLNLRKVRMQMYEGKKPFTSTKSALENKKNSKKEDDLQKENSNKEPETLWEWITR